jgi:hypothetical protein
MPHAQITPLEHLLQCCQYTHGDAHIEKAFQILWQHPRLLTTHPFNSIAPLNPIAKAAINRFRAATKSLDQVMLSHLTSRNKDWLAVVLVSRQYHPDMLINILRWESNQAHSCDENLVRQTVAIIFKSHPDLLSSPSLSRLLTNIRGKPALSTDFQQFLDELMAVHPLFPSGR